MTCARCTVLLFFGMAVLAGCQAKTTNDVQPERSPTTEFSVNFLYASMPSMDPEVVSAGVIVVPDSFAEDDSFSGSWVLKSTSNGNVDKPLAQGFIAPLTGSANLEAHCRDEECVIELYPGVVDNNIEVIVPRSLRGDGRWQYLTDAGVSASGIVRISPDR